MLPPTYAIGIVAHVERGQQAHDLMDNVGAVYASLDNGTFGCHLNHKRVWRYLSTRQAKNANWLVVLEEDAVPVEGFAEQLTEALANAPVSVVSLYLGRLRPPQQQWMIGPATQRADERNACWIVSRQFLHGVGLAIRSDLVADMLNTIDETLPIDEAILAWAVKRRYRVGFTWPSLVDHADGETLLKHRDGQAREPGRVAWRAGTRTDWNIDAVEMN